MITYAARLTRWAAGSAAATILVAALAVGAHGRHLGPDDAEPPLPAETPRTPPYVLAHNYLSTRAAIDGPLGQLYETMKDSHRARGADLNVQFDYVMHLPDGAAYIVQLASFAELEALVTLLRKRLTLYSLALRRRSKHSFRGTYGATVSAGCPDGWFASGPVDMAPSGPAHRLSQGGKTFFGAAVDDTFMLLFPGGLRPPLKGVVAETGLDLEDKTNDCRVSLRPAS